MQASKVNIITNTVVPTGLPLVGFIQDKTLRTWSSLGWGPSMSWSLKASTFWLNRIWINAHCLTSLLVFTCTLQSVSDVDLKGKNPNYCECVSAGSPAAQVCVHAWNVALNHAGTHSNTHRSTDSKVCQNNQQRRIAATCVGDSRRRRSSLCSHACGRRDRVEEAHISIMLRLSCGLPGLRRRSPAGVKYQQWEIINRAVKRRNLWWAFCTRSTDVFKTLSPLAAKFSYAEFS